MENAMNTMVQACVKHLITLSSAGAMLLIAGPPAIAQTAPDLIVSRAPAAAPYVLAPANCGTNAPVLAFSVLVANAGGSESPVRPAPVIYAIDESTNPGIDSLHCRAKWSKTPIGVSDLPMG
jgi:hypothetical protein